MCRNHLSDQQTYGKTRVGLKKIFYSAPYVEAMFQIWWRSVHKWRHNLVHAKWCYILSNAAMHSIVQTTIHQFIYKHSFFFSENVIINPSSIVCIGRFWHTRTLDCIDILSSRSIRWYNGSLLLQCVEFSSLVAVHYVIMYCHCDVYRPHPSFSSRFGTSHVNLDEENTRNASDKNSFWL